MDPIYLIAFIAVFLLGVALGRATKRGTDRSDQVPTVDPYRKARSRSAGLKKTKQSSQDQVLSPVPDLPVFSAPLRKSPKASKLKKGSDVTDKLEDEDKALVVSLICSGQMCPPKQVFKQILNLR